MEEFMFVLAAVTLALVAFAIGAALAILRNGD
jgi:hypothetical protein